MHVSLLSKSKNNKKFKKTIISTKKKKKKKKKIKKWRNNNINDFLCLIIKNATKFQCFNQRKKCGLCS